MMRSLVPNVGDDGIRVGLTHRKRAITRLPMKPAELLAFGFYPLRRTGFYRFDDFGKRLCPGEPTEDVDMIAHSTDLDRGATNIVEDSRKAGMNFCEHIALQPVLAILRAEDQMGEKTGERLRHGCKIGDRSLSGRSNLKTIPQAAGLTSIHIRSAASEVAQKAEILQPSPKGCETYGRRMRAEGPRSSSLRGFAIEFNPSRTFSPPLWVVT